MKLPEDTMEMHPQTHEYYYPEAYRNDQNSWVDYFGHKDLLEQMSWMKAIPGGEANIPGITPEFILEVPKSRLKTIQEDQESYPGLSYIQDWLVRIRNDMVGKRSLDWNQQYAYERARDYYIDGRYLEEGCKSIEMYKGMYPDVSKAAFVYFEKTDKKAKEILQTVQQLNKDLNTPEWKKKFAEDPIKRQIIVQLVCLLPQGIATCYDPIGTKKQNAGEKQEEYLKSLMRALLPSLALWTWQRKDDPDLAISTLAKTQILHRLVQFFTGRELKEFLDLIQSSVVKGSDSTNEDPKKQWEKFDRVLEKAQQALAYEAKESMRRVDSLFFFEWTQFLNSLTQENTLKKIPIQKKLQDFNSLSKKHPTDSSNTRNNTRKLLDNIKIVLEYRVQVHPEFCQTKYSTSPTRSRDSSMGRSVMGISDIQGTSAYFRQVSSNRSEATRDARCGRAGNENTRGLFGFIRIWWLKQ